jgi:hypothetical protein
MFDAKSSDIKRKTMRTTLDIADDVLFAAKEIAKREKKTVGAVVSEWARRSFHATPTALGVQEPPPLAEGPLAKYGFQPLPHRGEIVTNELVNRIREQEGI